MFRSLIAFVMLLAVAAFAPAARSSQKHMHVYMKNELPALNKIIGSAVVASALFGGAVVPGRVLTRLIYSPTQSTLPNDVILVESSTL